MFQINSWISGQISWLKDLANVQIQSTQRNRRECLEVREELNELVQELEKGSHIHEIDDAIHFHEEELCRKLTSYFDLKKFRKNFAIGPKRTCLLLVIVIVPEGSNPNLVNA